MLATRPLALCAALALLAVCLAAPDTRGPRTRRQLADDDQLQPLEEADADEQTREKRKLEGVTQAKFGIKNAVLGFVFGSGTTWRRRAQSTVRSSWPRAGHPTEQGARRALSSSSSTAQEARRARQTTDDIPEFDRNKVSLQVPGSLFGPSVSLLIRTTKIIGDVVQNSAVRYQTFLRLFRPLFRGPFEIKGLDPPTTTTTTTTTTARSTTTTTTQPTNDNEVRRR